MDIDAVITWVDGDDPLHAEKRASYSGESNHPASTSATRFASRGELKYSVLSILRFCPFVRKIHIVTDGQDPSFLWQVLGQNPDWHEKVELVDHSAIYGEHSDLLPVFSSRSIETMLHRIPGLSEHFIYFNDDMFVGRPQEPSFFFRSGKPVLRGAFKKSSGPLTRLKQFFRRGVRRPGFKEAQKEAAEVVGFSGEYFLTEHLPYPMKRSTLSNYYRGRVGELRQQAGHRFRSASQLSPIGLANHLELREGAPVEPASGGGYIKPPKGARARARVSRTLADLMDGRLTALCVQSLDVFSDDDREMVLSHLDRWYDHPGANAPSEP
jgi:hypothetical protein